MTKRTRTLHFTLGENAGKLLIDIAREHLTCNYDTDRAMRTLTISNMLHNQIADALCAAGIIPSVDPKDPLSHNPDTWLERHGWAKIHGDWILFDGWNLHRTDDKNIPMTPQQQEQICRYGQTCWKGLLKFGYSKEPISAARFGMTDIPMLRNYFEL